MNEDLGMDLTPEEKAVVAEAQEKGLTPEQQMGLLATVSHLYEQVDELKKAIHGMFQVHKRMRGVLEEHDETLRQVKQTVNVLNARSKKYVQSRAAGTIVDFSDLSLTKDEEA